MNNPPNNYKIAEQNILTALSRAGWLDAIIDERKGENSRMTLNPTTEGLAKMRQLATLLSEIEVRGQLPLGEIELFFLHKFLSGYNPHSPLGN